MDICAYGGRFWHVSNNIMLAKSNKKYQILQISLEYGTILSLPPLDWQGKGVLMVDVFIAFFVAVTADVVCHYIIKWLDGLQ